MKGAPVLHWPKLFEGRISLTRFGDGNGYGCDNGYGGYGYWDGNGDGYGCDNGYGGYGYWDGNGYGYGRGKVNGSGDG